MRRILVLCLIVLSAGVLAAPPVSKVFGRAYVSKPTYLWSEPTSFGAARAKLPVGTPVEIVRANTDKNWIKVRLGTGGDGYILRKNLSSRKPASQRVSQQKKTSPKPVGDSNPRQPASPEDEPPPILDDVPLAPSASGSDDNRFEEDGMMPAQAGALQDDFSPANDEEPEAPSNDVYADDFENVDMGSNATSGESPNDPLLDEFESIYGQDAKAAQAKQKKAPRRARKKKGDGKEADQEFADNARFSVAPHLEWADQFSHDNTFGWGLGVFGLYHLNTDMAVGFSISLNRFHERVEYTDLNLEISRTAKRWLIGPMFRYKVQSFRMDAVLGWDRTQTKFKASDTATGEDLVEAAGAAFVGSYTDSAIGLNLRAAYAWELQENMALEFYLGYGIGFYGGESAVSESKGRTPQQFMLGSAFSFGF